GHVPTTFLSGMRPFVCEGLGGGGSKARSVGLSHVSCFEVTCSIVEPALRVIAPPRKLGDADALRSVIDLGSDDVKSARRAAVQTTLSFTDDEWVLSVDDAQAGQSTLQVARTIPIEVLESRERLSTVCEIDAQILSGKI